MGLLILIFLTAKGAEYGAKVAKKGNRQEAIDNSRLPEVKFSGLSYGDVATNHTNGLE